MAPSHLSSSHWRRLVLSGTAVGSAAAGSAAMAGVVQITQVGNEVTSSADNLRADLTGDGVMELPGLQGAFGTNSIVFTFGNYWSNYNFASAYFNPPGTATRMFLGWAAYRTRGTGTTPFVNTTESGYVQSVNNQSTTSPLSASGMFSITFNDVLVNGGDTTNALLEVRAFSTSKTSHTVRLVRLVFNSASTAAPTGAGTTAGSPAPEFNRAAAATARNAAIAALKKKIAVATKKLRKAKQSKQISKAVLFTRKIKNLKARLASL